MSNAAVTQNQNRGLTQTADLVIYATSLFQSRHASCFIKGALNSVRREDKTLTTLRTRKTQKVEFIPIYARIGLLITVVITYEFDKNHYLYE